MILGIFILQGLQIQEPLNIASCTISTVSVVYGFGDYLAYIVNDGEAGAPFVVSIWGVLANVIDSLFRAILIAYLLTIVKYYALLVVPVYVAFMVIAICIKKKELSINSADFFGTLMSFGCSPCEESDFKWVKGKGIRKRIVKYRFRALSKVTFGLIFPPILGFLLYATIKLPNIHNDLDIDLKNTTICQNICPSQFESSNELNKTMVDGYCRNVWRHFETSPDLSLPVNHLVFIVTLAVLFLLSTIEGVLEVCVEWAPYRKLYSFIPNTTRLRHFGIRNQPMIQLK